MFSWFPNVREEAIFEGYTAALFSNTKNCKISRKVIGENRPKTICLHIWIYDNLDNVIV